jgi:diguanylate cyclase (GGDEF)-like protein
MSEATDSTFQQKLQALQQKYLQRLSERIAEIEETWRAFLCEGESYETFRTFHRLVHGVAGASATHGIFVVSEVARRLEVFVQELLESNTPCTIEHRLHISALLYELHAVVAGNTVSNTPSLSGSAELSATAPDLRGPDLRTHQPAAPQPATAPPQDGREYTAPTIVTPHETQRWSVASHMVLSGTENRLIFLVEDDEELAQDIALQISHFGYTVYIFERPEDLKREIERYEPAAILMDVVFPAGNLAGVETVQEINACYGNSIPVVFMSARDDVTARLQVVRAGGKAYFVKPVNIPALVDRLDELTTHNQPEPYRILIIDDDPSVADFYRLVLEQHDMIVTVVNNPLDIMYPLLDFRPDLILMDMYMPQCTGRELASVIRQQETYVGIPIVFLSTETDIEKQLTAMHEGRGDDFLTKSIQPTHLISVVKNRAHRSRVLRDSMVRDSLTGLFNHTTTKQYLQREVLFARRRQTAMSFAMIDLDHFKNINDTYGHPTGDRVLKSLARVLQQRLRRTDIIGRYGGEEFAVMLPDTDGSKAAGVLDEIRQDFSQVRQRSEQDEFHVTFSCGIADFPRYQDAAIINKIADEALYHAKHQGRNRVVLAAG